jgi:uroporphyrinogen decarboxylase
MSKPLLAALRSEKPTRTPLWLMRQAGRYLPEYRELRAKAGGFLDLCYNPAYAAEITLQPLRRFDLDAAILFSDILVIPKALGQDLRFETGEGPALPPIRDLAGLEKLDQSRFLESLSPIFETVRRVKTDLPPQATLIGFAGAPWTVACYMVEGGGSKEFAHVKSWAFRDPDSFQVLIDLLVEKTIIYLSAQCDAGAEAVQLFDSWASALPPAEFNRWVIQPTAKIVKALREKHPHIPFIGFPRGAGFGFERYVRETGVNGVGIDQNVPADWARDHLQPLTTVQGNLDPILLLTGGNRMEEEANRLLETLSPGRFIFNLGHGVLQQTPPDHVARLVDLVHGKNG